MKSLLLSAVAALTLSAVPASAAQIILNESNVIASSGGYTGGGVTDPGDFAASNIFDQQTGDVIDRHAYDDTAFGPGTYWLNGNAGPTAAFITIDLGAAYRLTNFDLFNTHNGSYKDRGTGNFTILGSNDAMFGMGNTTQLVSGTLAAADYVNSRFEPLTAQGFLSQSNAAFRYLQFRPTSVATVNPACCGPTASDNVYGLNELRVFAAVPEPTTWALMILGVGLVGGAMRRRRALTAPALA